MHIFFSNGRIPKKPGGGGIVHVVVVVVVEFILFTIGCLNSDILVLYRQKISSVNDFVQLQRKGFRQVENLVHGP